MGGSGTRETFVPSLLLHPLLNPLAILASGLGARVSGSQVSYIPSPAKVGKEACGLRGAVLPWDA